MTMDNHSVLTRMPTRLTEGDEARFRSAYGDLFAQALRDRRQLIRSGQGRAGNHVSRSMAMGAPDWRARQAAGSSALRVATLMRALEDARRQASAHEGRERLSYSQQRMAEREGIRAADRQALYGAARYHQGEAEKLGNTLLSFVSFGGGGG